jgi:hypothetical protein
MSLCPACRVGHAIGAIHACAELYERDLRGELTMTTLIPFVLSELCYRLADCDPDGRVEALSRTTPAVLRWIGHELTIEAEFGSLYDDDVLVIAAIGEVLDRRRAR